MTDARRLDDLGERRIIEEIFRPRYGGNESAFFGDDCAVVANDITLPGNLIVATTDPCPEPMASFLGFTDVYYRGWLLATINLSDLGAVGARPLGLLTSLILRNDMTVAQLIRLIDGIDDCCRLSDTSVIGGNIKEGSKIDVSATAIGVCAGGKFLSRRGCHAGDSIVVVGDLGLFWSGVLASRRQIPLRDHESLLLKNVLTPEPKVRLGQELAANEVLSACLDNSDGLYPSLAQLAAANGVQMCINMKDVEYLPAVLYVCSQIGIDPIRLSLGWGDWQLIGCCQSSRLSVLKETARKYDTDVYIIGEVRSGQGVVLEHEGRVASMAPIDSQRFTKDSWFTAGIESYINMITEGPIWGSET